MASQKKEWQVTNGPSQWALTVSYWESIPGDKKVVNFTLVNPNRPSDQHMLQMEVLVMGRGPLQNMHLFFSGPSVLFLGFNPEKNTYAVSVGVGKAKVCEYAIHNRSGKAVFVADVRSFDDR
jgi:hypothetical protein